jgi:hypothetical protein
VSENRLTLTSIAESSPSVPRRSGGPEPAAIPGTALSKHPPLSKPAPHGIPAASGASLPACSPLPISSIEGACRPGLRRLTPPADSGHPGPGCFRDFLQSFCPGLRVLRPPNHHRQNSTMADRSTVFPFDPGAFAKAIPASDLGRGRSLRCRVPRAGEEEPSFQETAQGGQIHGREARAQHASR